MIQILDKSCIVLLACKDYESTQLTIAHLLALTPASVPIYFLPNSMEDTFESMCVKELGTIYSNLYPHRFIYVNWIKPSFPYQSIGDLLFSKQLEKYEYICKIDDDVFPITENWIEKLAESFAKNDDGNLAYTTGLINNNPWGFGEIVEAFGLKEEYTSIIPKTTFAGKNIPGYMNKKEVVAPNIDRGGFGTVWQFPHLAKWIHEKTTLLPQSFIEKTANLSEKEVDNKLRYSIGCMFFRKRSWADIHSGAYNDEKIWHLYCMKNNKRIISVRSVPIVHLFFFNQRLSNKMIVHEVFNTYKKFLKDRVIYVWDFSTENKLFFIEERLSQIESMIRSRKYGHGLAMRFKKILNKVRFTIFRKW
ncbi:MAG: hypothetical protein Q8859_02140 [Bacteroidota bacterium]|nr:hypothetical protein [Bacteroidota bacterium]